MLIRGARILANERPPDEAEIPFDRLAAATFPKIGFSGGHNAAFDAVCAVLAERLPAELAVIPRAGHAVQMTGDAFNDRLTAFIEGTLSSRSPSQGVATA